MKIFVFILFGYNNKKYSEVNRDERKTFNTGNYIRFQRVYDFGGKERGDG